MSLAKSVGAKITAITVEAPFKPYEVPESELQNMSEVLVQRAEQNRQHASGVLTHIAAVANASGIPCKTVQLEHDQPDRAILKTAQDNCCDLIIMASHGRSGISAVLLGSVTDKVLKHSKIPVLVCR